VSGERLAAAGETELVDRGTASCWRSAKQNLLDVIVDCAAAELPAEAECAGGRKEKQDAVAAGRKTPEAIRE
jgi:hypothetical protein